jgi:hypothetical protein
LKSWPHTNRDTLTGKLKGYSFYYDSVLGRGLRAMLEQLFKCALVHIETASLKVMQREFDDVMTASADQLRPGLPMFYSLLYKLVSNELERRQSEPAENEEAEKEKVIYTGLFI